MRTRHKNLVSRLMLLSGFILLLTVIVPHHHHEDGSPCIFLWEDDHSSHEDKEHHSCQSNGHTVAFNPTSLNKHAQETGNDVALLLIPLHTLFDYINSSLPSVPKRAHRTGETLFAESLYNIWAPVATGFRAPPSC